MVYGEECATIFSTGVRTMPEWCVDNLASLPTVRCNVYSYQDIQNVYGDFIGAYLLDDASIFGKSERSPVLGEVHCIGTEPELLECSHKNIGYHYCISTSPDFAISCYGIYISPSFINMLTFTYIRQEDKL